MSHSADENDSRFKPHVSFDNFSGQEPTENNAISFTLNKKHTGYQYKKRSRTFMVGIDENEYSNTAVRWMVDELVDDGDEIVCVRVVEPDSKIISSKSLEREIYKDEANATMEKIQAMNADHNRAISIVLEFAVGKLHTTFQKMINLYEPTMLIVGTKGRPLGGLQGLMNNRSSFSKWCLQYSPIPVVVVRPDEKREKKKIKRANDPARRNYALLLAESGAPVHETNAKPGGSFEKAGSLALTSDQEAHAVAAALGLPAQFDPKQRPVFVPANLVTERRRSDGSDHARRGSYSPDLRPGSQSVLVIPPGSKVRTDSPSVSDEDEADESEYEYEATPGGASIRDGDEEEDIEDAIVKRERLHAMEVGEAAALAGRKASVSSVGTDDDDG